MPDGNKQCPAHPLLSEGETYAGSVFLELLDYALASVRVTIGRGKVRAPEHKIQDMKAARGFTEEVMDNIRSGSYPVSVEQIQQLLIDLYPTPLSRSDSRVALMESIVNGTWKGTVRVHKPKPVVTKTESSVAATEGCLIDDHGERILLLCDACGVPLSRQRRSLLEGRTAAQNLAPAMLGHITQELRLPEGVLMGRLHFNRDMAPVKNGEKWRGPQGPFVPGDVRAGILWRNMVRKYRAIRFWFEREYGLTDELVSLISNGKLGVPIPVHLILMQKAKERLASVNDPVIPRFYTALLELEASIPAKLMELGKTETPCKDWFQDWS